MSVQTNTQPHDRIKLTGSKRQHQVFTTTHHNSSITQELARVKHWDQDHTKERKIVRGAQLHGFWLGPLTQEIKDIQNSHQLSQTTTHIGQLAIATTFTLESKLVALVRIARTERSLFVILFATTDNKIQDKSK